MKKYLLIIPLLFTLTGCSYLKEIDVTRAISYAVDSSVMVTSLLKLDDTVRAARVSINENKDKFSETEWAKLEVAGRQIDSIREKFEDIFSDTNIRTKIMSSVQLKFLIGDVFDVYDEVEEIVLLHAESFSETQRLQVLVAKRTMDDLKSSYARIRNNAETSAKSEPINITALIQQAIKAVQLIASVFAEK
jgi:hypothetical protein